MSGGARRQVRVEKWRGVRVTRRLTNVKAVDEDGMLDERRAVYALVADVVDAVEADLDVLVTNIADRVRARMPARNRVPSTAHNKVLRSGVEAAVRAIRDRPQSPSDDVPHQIRRICAPVRR
jgi:hypothetical protein